MKKLMAALATVLFLSLALGLVPGPAGDLLPPAPANASFGIEVPLAPLPDIPVFAEPTVKIPGLPTATPKPTKNLPGLPTFSFPLFTPKPTDSATPKPTLEPDKPLVTDIPQEKPTATPTRKPTAKPSSGGGQTMTGEGPLFLSFRNELTDERWMFTPMDLSLDGEYHFPLIGSASQVVGEAKVAVRSGMVIVTYLVVNGVKVDEKNEFFTFFPDIRSVPSVKPSQLQHVKLQFGLPYSVAGWLNSDPNVLLYINCPVSYKTNLPGLTPFSFQDPGYLERMMGLLPLMD